MRCAQLTFLWHIRSCPFNLIVDLLSPSVIKRYRMALLSHNLLYYNADSMSRISDEELERQLGGKYTAAEWFWELSRMPARFTHELERVDEMWVASNFVRESILTATQMPVQVIPIPIEFAEPAQVDLRAFGIPDDRYVFLFSFAATSHGERKNPFGLIDAFERAFGHPGDKGPLLVIKAHHADDFLNSVVS